MKKNQPKAPRNALVLPMTLGRKAGIMKDRRSERGGAKNNQVEYLEENYEDSFDGYSEGEE